MSVHFHTSGRVYSEPTLFLNVTPVWRNMPHYFAIAFPGQHMNDCVWSGRQVLECDRLDFVMCFGVAPIRQLSVAGPIRHRFGVSRRTIEFFPGVKADAIPTVKYGMPLHQILVWIGHRWYIFWRISFHYSLIQIIVKFSRNCAHRIIGRIVPGWMSQNGHQWKSADDWKW